MSEHEVWKAAAEGSAPRGAPAARLNEAGLPRPLDLLSDSVNDLFKNFVPYLLAGLGIVCVTLPLSLVLFGGALAVAAFVGVALEAEDLMGLLFGVGAIGAIGVLVVVTAPLNAGLTRGMWAWIDEGRPLRFGSAFTDLNQDALSVIGLAWLLLMMTGTGLVFCYLPALIPGLLFSFALPAVAIHRRGVFEALGVSARHVTQHFVWHLGYHFLGLGIVLVASQIPLIGTMIGGPIYLSYTLRAYRAIFGAGSEAHATGARVP
jgi:hypothetical protein